MEKPQKIILVTYYNRIEPNALEIKLLGNSSLILPNKARVIPQGFSVLNPLFFHQSAAKAEYTRIVRVHTMHAFDLPLVI